MPIERSKITREMLEKAKECKTPEELIALSKTGGIELTKTEAEEYIAELENIELDNIELEKIAGGGSCYMDCASQCTYDGFCNAY